MLHTTMEARMFIEMYLGEGNGYYLFRALENDYTYTVSVAIEKGFYWQIADVVREFDPTVEYGKLQLVG